MDEGCPADATVIGSVCLAYGFTIATALLAFFGA